MKRKIVFIIGVILILVLVFVSGCGNKTTTTNTTPTTPVEPSYAGGMTDNIMTSINEGNYINFSRDLDQTMKAALPETAFQGLKSQLQDKIGDYVSKQFYTTVVQEDITTVAYIAKYTKEANVTVTVSFRTVDGKNLVAGLHFPSLQ